METMVYASYLYILQKRNSFNIEKFYQKEILLHTIHNSCKPHKDRPNICIHIFEMTIYKHSNFVWKHVFSSKIMVLICSDKMLAYFLSPHYTYETSTRIT